MEIMRYLGVAAQTFSSDTLEAGTEAGGSR